VSISTRNEQRFPKDWDEKERVKRLIAELEGRTDGECSAADEAAAEGGDSVIESGERALLLSNLLQRAFQMSGESVPLGFDVSRIRPTLAMLPGGLVTGLEALFVSVWPSDSFHLGSIELFGPDRINYEHEELLPSCLIVKHGFLGIGSDGAGSIYSYCVEDKRIYLIPHEYVSEDAVYTEPWERLDPSDANIKAISERSWDSLAALFDWALAELQGIESEGSDQTTT
jgi:hypothetical protein